MRLTSMAFWPRIQPVIRPNWAVALCAALALILVIAVSPATFPVYAQGEDSYESQLAKGNDFLRRQRWEEALKSFKKANDLKEKRSIEASLGMVEAYHGLAAYKNVIETCEKIIEMAAGDASTVAQ